MPRRQRQRRARNIRPAKKDEVRLRQAIQGQVFEVWEMLQRELLPILEVWKGDTSIKDSATLIKDGFIDDIQRAIERVSGDLVKMAPLQQAIASSFVEHSFNNNTNRFEKSVERAGGDPSLKRIIKNEQIGGVLASSANQSVDLIKSVPDKYMDDVRGAIMRNYQTGEFNEKKGGLVGELRRLTGIAKNRAELIARDQVNKLNGSLTQIRSEELGAIGYRWHNSNDTRVRGNPSGKYPNVPKNKNHWDREDVYFLWKKWGGSEKKRPIAPDGKPFRDPPVDGNPGMAINCRCDAEPVFTA